MTEAPLHSLTIAASAVASSPADSVPMHWWMWLALGACVGIVVTWFVMRSIGIRRARETATAIERIGVGGNDTDLARLTDALPESWSPIANAIRRTTRLVDGRERAMVSRLHDLEAILHSTTAGFVALDPQQLVLDLNPAAAHLLGVSATGARGRLFQEITRHPELNRFLVDALASEASIERDCRVEGVPQRYVRAISEPLRDATGRSVGLLLSLQDVTRIRRLEALRSDFVANVSHELRTPITSIKGYVETLLQVGSDDPVQVRRFLEIVQRSTQRLSSLVEDLLALASLEQSEHSEREDLSFTETNVAAIVHVVVELLGSAAEARRITLRTQLKPDLVVVANHVLVEQALANLVGNAIRYSPESTTVHIAASRRADMIEISVRDEGPGIAASQLERIFERFYRVDRARSSAGGGTGLGLAIVKHIAQVHGGSVEVASEWGVGSTFRLLLPSGSMATVRPAPTLRAS